MNTKPSLVMEIPFVIMTTCLIQSLPQSCFMFFQGPGKKKFTKTVLPDRLNENPAKKCRGHWPLCQETCYFIKPVITYSLSWNDCYGEVACACPTLKLQNICPRCRLFFLFFSFFFFFNVLFSGPDAWRRFYHVNLLLNGRLRNQRFVANFDRS